MANNQEAFTSFHDFWPFYLSQHQNPSCRLLHFIGSGLAAVLMGVTLMTHSLGLLFLALLMGYGFAWIGHFVFEKNKPATFRYPLYSLRGDCRMFWLKLTGRLDEEFQKFFLNHDK